jgi:CspA family cold shock protein
MQGKVKFYNSGKGYGFIAPDQGGPDIFVHASALEAAGLRVVIEGQDLVFDVVNDSRRGKTSAQNIRAV